MASSGDTDGPNLADVLPLFATAQLDADGPDVDWTAGWTVRLEALAAALSALPETLAELQRVVGLQDWPQDAELQAKCHVLASATYVMAGNAAADLSRLAAEVLDRYGPDGLVDGTDAAATELTALLEDWRTQLLDWLPPGLVAAVTDVAALDGQGTEDV